MSIHIKHYLVTHSSPVSPLSKSFKIYDPNHSQHLRYCPILKPARSRTMSSQQKQPSVYTQSPSLEQFSSDSSLPRNSSTTKSLSPSLDDVTEKGEEEEEEEEEEKEDNEAGESKQKDKKKKKQSKISALKSFLSSTNKNNDNKKKKDNESKTSPFASSSSSSSKTTKTTPTTPTIDHLKSRLFIESGLNL